MQNTYSEALFYLSETVFVAVREEDELYGFETKSYVTFEHEKDSRETDYIWRNLRC